MKDNLLKLWIGFSTIISTAILLYLPARYLLSMQPVMGRKDRDLLAELDKWAIISVALFLLYGAICLIVKFYGSIRKNPIKVHFGIAQILAALALPLVVWQLFMILLGSMA